jgi:signal transduction histidine kinase
MLANPDTQYASARRSDPYTIDRQKKIVSAYCGSLNQLFDAVSEVILIVNENRQIVFFNSIVPSLLNVEDSNDLFGMRPGEALGCANACNSPGGCGTSEFCTQCGAVNAILASLSKRADLRECRMLNKDTGEALNLLVRTTPLVIEDQSFSIVAIVDISHQKRRRAMEHIFFHDIMNTAASLNQIAIMLDAKPHGEDAAVLRQHLVAGMQQLIDELVSQKELLAAENNELKVKVQPVDGNLLIQNVVKTYRDRFHQHTIVVDAADGDVTLNTDQRLLRRVVGNMIGNALEASRPDTAVHLACRARDGHAEFSVHNDAYIPRTIQLQLFQRSFSTKGDGRGLGTYSMKLLTERYLNGSILMKSSPQHGTVFKVRLPL